MNRFTRRLANRRRDPRGVTLSGGPMDGWTVTRDAPALDAEWWRTWTDTIAATNRPGRYVRLDVGRARWREDE